MTNIHIYLVKRKNTSILIGLLFLPFQSDTTNFEISISIKSSFRLKEATEGKSQNQQRLNRVLKHINTFQNLFISSNSNVIIIIIMIPKSSC